MPRYRQWSAAMAVRMNQDLVFDHTEALMQAMPAEQLAIGRWKDIAKSIGMSAADIDDFAPAFEHPELSA